MHDSGQLKDVTLKMIAMQIYSASLKVKKSLGLWVYWPMKKCLLVLPHWLDHISSLAYPTTVGSWLDFGRDTREPMFAFFPFMPSVHRMDYSWLQLKSRLFWLKVRVEIWAFCVTAKTPLVPFWSTNVTSAITIGILWLVRFPSPGNLQVHPLFLWLDIIFLHLNAFSVRLISS